MSILRPIPFLVLALLAGPAHAADGEPEASAEAEAEGEDTEGEDADGAEGEDGDDGAEGEDGDEDDGPAAPEAVTGDPAAWGLDAAPLDEEPADKSHKSKMARELDRAPWFTIQLGAAGTQILDSGWSMLGSTQGPPNAAGARSGVGMVERFHFGLDVYPHPQIGVSVGLANKEGQSKTVGSDVEGGLTFATTTTSFDVAGKFILAPPFLLLRPYARAGAGFFRVQVDLTGDGGNDNLATRQYDGATPYALLGGGLEIVSPRRVIGRDDLPRMRWGFGFFVEGGATLGGGGADVDAAPTVILGDLGDLSLGPAYVRMGLVILL